MSQRRTAPAAFQWLVFPVVMSAAVAWSLYWMTSGTPAPESILVPQLSAFAVVALLEHLDELGRRGVVVGRCVRSPRGWFDDLEAYEL